MKKILCVMLLITLLPLQGMAQRGKKPGSSSRVRQRIMAKMRQKTSSLAELPGRKNQPTQPQASVVVEHMLETLEKSKDFILSQKDVPQMRVRDIPGTGRVYSFQTPPGHFELLGNQESLKKLFPEYELTPGEEKTYIIQVNSRRGHPHFLSVGMGRLVERLTVFNLQQNSPEMWQAAGKPLQYEDLLSLVQQLENTLSFPVKTESGEEGRLYTLPVPNLEISWDGQTLPLNPKESVIFYNSQQNTAHLIEQNRTILNRFILTGPVPDELQDKSGPQN